MRIWDDGQCEIGEWEGDCMKNVVTYLAEGDWQIANYNSETVKKEGLCHYFYKNGALDSCIYKDGKQHGEGRHIFSDFRERKGVWVE